MPQYTVVLCLLWAAASKAFSVHPPPSRTSQTAIFAKTAKKKLDKNKKFGRQSSKVVDPDGPTPTLESAPIDELQDLPELDEITNPDDLPRPIPHQPWRRGDTAGCEAPIAAEWRQTAEDIIYKSVDMVGGRVLDVTWYLTQLVVTLDEEMRPSPNMLKASGPPIEIKEPQMPMYFDPEDPEPEEIWSDDDDVVYVRENEEEAIANAERRRTMYAPKDPDDDPEEDHIPDVPPDNDVKLFANEETREDEAFVLAHESATQHEEQEQPMDIDTIKIDSAALSTIAQAILSALEDYEEELHVLARHELILTSPGASDVIETQRQFDAYRGFDVVVETQDPFESNRTLKGKLVDRNSMDLILNKKGRMVTVPLNFVKCVRLPPAKREKGVPRDAPF